MQAVNNVLKWSFVTSSAVGFLTLSGVFAGWFAIQVLVMVTAITP